MKAGVKYTVKMQTKWLEGDNPKWGFRVLSNEGEEQNYVEFFADSGNYCYGGEGLAYSGRALSGGAAEESFTFTPKKDGYFLIWSCEGEARALIDNLSISPDELADPPAPAAGRLEDFENAADLSDTGYLAPDAQVSVTTEGAISGDQSLRVSTSGDYKILLQMDSGNVLLRANTEYTVSFKLKLLSGNNKWGFRLMDSEGGEQGYYEFWADTGAWCYGGEGITASHRLLSGGVVEMSFTFTRTKNLSFELWSCMGNAEALLDDVRISPDDVTTPVPTTIPDGARVEDFEEAESLKDTLYTAPDTSLAVLRKDGAFSGETSLLVSASGGGYLRLLELDGSRAMLKAGVRYTVGLKIKWLEGNTKLGFRLLNASGQEQGCYQEFSAQSGAAIYGGDGLTFKGQRLPGGIIEVYFTFIPRENGIFMIWSCEEGLVRAMLDDVVIAPNQLVQPSAVEGKPLWPDASQGTDASSWQEDYLLGTLQEGFEKASSLEDTAFVSGNPPAVLVSDGALNGERSLYLRARGLIRLDESYLRLKAGVEYQVSFLYKALEEDTWSFRLLDTDGQVMDSLDFSTVDARAVSEGKTLRLEGALQEDQTGRVVFTFIPEKDGVFALYTSQAAALLDDIEIVPVHVPDGTGDVPTPAPGTGVAAAILPAALFAGASAVLAAVRKKRRNGTIMK